MKKLLAMLMTLAVAVILGMGTVGCSKKDDKDKKPAADAAAKDKDGAAKDKDAAAKDKDAAPKDKAK